MSMRHEENDIYIIPPNFIDTGTVFGGTIQLRNAAEALVLSLLIGFPVFHIPATLTTVAFRTKYNFFRTKYKKCFIQGI